MRLTHKKILTPALFVIGSVFLLSFTVITRSVTGGLRADMTAEHLYTLSDSTKKLLKDLDEPIKARFFYTPKQLNGIPVLHAYAERVKTLLTVYERLSKGKFSVELIEPQPFSTEEDDAVAFGVEPVPLDESGAQLYFGVSLNNSVDETKVFPFLNPERESFLEYDITRAIYDLSLAKKPSVTILSGIELEGSPGGGMFGMGGGEAWTILTYLQEEFDVTMMDAKAQNIPGDTGILVLIRPALLNDDQLYAIDQFVVGGGKLLLFTDPKTEASFTAGDDVNALSALLDHWRLSYNPDLAVLDIENAARASVMQDIGGGQSRSVYLDRPDWLVLRQEQLNTDYPATANLRQLLFKSAGSVSYNPEESDTSMTWQPLVTTSASAMEVKQSDIADTEVLLRDYLSTDTAYTLAGRLTGMFTSAFPERATKDGGINKASAEGTVIVVTDTDMLHDSTWLQKQNFLGNELHTQLSDNGAFALNLVDSLEGAGILSGLRGRTRVERPFEKVNDIRREAERDFLLKQQRLQQRLTDIQQQLAALSEQSRGRDTLVSSQQQLAAEDFRKQILETRTELRQVQLALREDIESLGTWIKFLLVAFIPGLAILAGIFLPGRIAGVKRNA